MQSLFISYMVFLQLLQVYSSLQVKHKFGHSNIDLN